MGCIGVIGVFIVLLIGIPLSLMGVQSDGAFTAIFLAIFAAVILWLLASMGIFNKKDK